jgi:DNA polymerase-3 subunit delta'
VVRKVEQEEELARRTEEVKNRFPLFDLRDESVRKFLDARLDGVIPPLLFIGPEGSGKEHAAIDLARRLCCSMAQKCSLGGVMCESCRQAVAFEHPGIHVVYPTPTQGGGEKPGDDEADMAKVLAAKRADIFDTHRFSKKVSIRIARARAIIRRANTKPFGSTRNVFVVAQADLMREEAQNALLKLVEEPPEHCALVFVTETPDSILYTVRSRCQRVRFPPMRAETIELLLTQYYGARQGAARRVAELSQGNIRRAREMLEEQDDETRAQAYEILARLHEATESWAIQNALLLTRGRSRDNVARFLHEFASAYRDVMAGDEALFINSDRATTLAAQVGKWDQKKLPGVLDRIIATRDGILRRNLNMDAALVSLFLDIKQLG